MAHTEYALTAAPHEHAHTWNPGIELMSHFDASSPTNTSLAGHQVSQCRPIAFWRRGRTYTGLFGSRDHTFCGHWQPSMPQSTRKYMPVYVRTLGMRRPCAFDVVLSAEDKDGTDTGHRSRPLITGQTITDTPEQVLPA